MRMICVDDATVILEHTVKLCEGMPQIDEVRGFTNPLEALDFVKENPVDLALLDIEMPEMNGIQLAGKIKEVRPGTAVIFLTAYSQYAVEAFSVRASGYLLKPVTVDALTTEIGYVLAARPKKMTGDVVIRTFGNFDVYVKEQPVRFKSAKGKELLAYLVDRRGANVTRAEAFSVLWEDRDYDRGMQKSFDVVIRRLRETLREYKIENIFEMKQGTMRVCPEHFTCDAYLFYDGDVDVINTYPGEYMSSYSWASMTESFLTWKLTGER